MHYASADTAQPLLLNHRPSTYFPLIAANGEENPYVTPKKRAMPTELSAAHNGLTCVKLGASSPGLTKFRAVGRCEINAFT